MHTTHAKPPYFRCSDLKEPIKTTRYEGGTVVNPKTQYVTTEPDYPALIEYYMKFRVDIINFNYFFDWLASGLPKDIHMSNTEGTYQFEYLWKDCYCIGTFINYEKWGDQYLEIDLIGIFQDMEENARQLIEQKREENIKKIQEEQGKEVTVTTIKAPPLKKKTKTTEKTEEEKTAVTKQEETTEKTEQETTKEKYTNKGILLRQKLSNAMSIVGNYTYNESKKELEFHPNRNVIETDEKLKRNNAYRAFETAYKYLKEADKEANYNVFKRLPEILTSSDRTPLKIDIHTGRKTPHIYRGIIEWSYYAKAMDGEGNMHSPALILYHELIHAFHIAENIDAYKERWINKKVENYTNAEEQETVAKVNEVSKSLNNGDGGYGTRASHNDKSTFHDTEEDYKEPEDSVLDYSKPKKHQ